MSTREDGERQRSCSSRGLGIAAAAIGAGVGAALYYYFNKRAEDPNVPDAEGATSSWTCEQPQALEEEERRAILREQAFRERSWSPEECSICFDVMLRDDIVMSLPCTHRFHQHCILPWLQERQTCPNCRKQAE